MAEQITITKRYKQVITVDYNSWEYMTEITRTVEVSNAQELLTASEKLANTVKQLTLADIEKNTVNMVAQEVKHQ